MLARYQGRSFYLPLPTIASEHHQTARPFRSVSTSVGDQHIEILSPLSAILYREFKFHKL